MVKESLNSFLQSANNSNEYALYTFSRNVKLENNWTQDKSELTSSINNIDINKFVGVTKLYDACFDALQSLQSRKNQKRAVFLISDGGDNDSKHGFEDVKKLSNETLIPFYFVNVGVMKVGNIGSETGSLLDMQGQQISEEFAIVTGGITRFPLNQNQLIDDFTRIANYIRHQYMVGVSIASINKDGKKHKLQVQIPLTPDAPKEYKGLKIHYPQFYISKKL
jgi:Ca-activated chloride channel homolog